MTKAILLAALLLPFPALAQIGGLPVSPGVSGPASVTNGHLALWVNPNLLQDGGVDLSGFAVTPTGGSANTLAALLSGNAGLPGLSVTGTASLAMININGNLAGVNPCASDGNYGWNYQNGTGEMDAFSCYTGNVSGGNDAFAWYQKQTGGSLTKIMNLDKLGNLSLAQALAQAQGGTGATSLGAASVTPTGGSSGTLANFLSGNATLTGINESGSFNANSGSSGTNNFTATGADVSSGGNYTVQLNSQASEGSSGQVSIAFDRTGTQAMKIGLENTGKFSIGGWSWGADEWAIDSSGNTTQKGSSTVTNSMKISGTTTVSALPTCNSGAEGTHYNVSDALAPAWNVTLTGGSTAHVGARCNGTNWVAE